MVEGGVAGRGMLSQTQRKPTIICSPFCSTRLKPSASVVRPPAENAKPKHTAAHMSQRTAQHYFMRCQRGWCGEGKVWWGRGEGKVGGKGEGEGEERGGRER